VPEEVSEFPSLCVDSAGNLHLVYLAYTLLSHIRYKTWSPATGWQPSVIISTGTGDKQNPPSCAATPDGHIHVVWDELYNGHYEIFYREKISGVWQPPIKISDTTNMTDKGAATIAGGRDNSIYCAWKGEHPVLGWTHIYYRHRIGGVWQASPTDVSSGLYSDQCDYVGDPYGPSIAVDNSNVVHIVWYGGEQADNYYYRVYYRRRHPTSGWLAIDTIAGANQPDDFDRFAPQITIDRQQNARVVWFGEDYWTDGWLHLWHKKRTPAGWLATEELSGEYPEGDLYNPHIANDTLGLHLIWFDDRYESEEIFRMVSYPQDVEIKEIISPPVFCSLASYQPKVVIRNSGEEEILTSFGVKVTINPGGYEDVFNVPYLGVGAEETLSFGLWTPSQADLYLVKCSLLISDQFSLNNKKSRFCCAANFIERFELTDGGFISNPTSNAWEWGTPSLVGPPSAHSGTKCWGTNIDGNYFNNANWQLNSIWYVATRDTPILGFYHWYRFQTGYDGGNVKFTKDGSNFFLLHPTFTEGYDRKLSSGNGGIPQESAYSRGVFDSIGWRAVLMPIPVSAGDTFFLRWHFGSDANFTYPGWYLDDVGGIGFAPLFHDVGVMEIVSPPDTVDSSISITPTVRVKNFGPKGETFSATMKIGSESETKIIALPAGRESLVPFFSWTPLVRGNSLVRCSLFLQSDENRVNDTLSKSFFVRVKDVGVLAIENHEMKVQKAEFGTQLQTENRMAKEILPMAWQIANLTDTLDSGDVYIPQARIKNFGNTPAEFWVRFSFGNLHSESLPLTLSPESETSLTFSPLPISGRGNLVKKCSTLLSGDLVPDNDAKEESVFVRVRDIGIVRFLSPTPYLPPGEITPEVIFSNNGNVENSFTAYLKIRDSLGNLLYADESTEINLLPSCSLSIKFQNWQAPIGQYTAFCSLSVFGDRVFLNDTLSLQFTVSSYQGWLRKADLTGARKNVKSGGCITAQDSFVYALVGNNTRDFLRYSILGNSWQRMESIPAGPRNKKVKKGACLTSDGVYLYALKGGGTNEFYRYNPVNNSWESLPFPSFIKGVKGGFITFVEKGGVKYIYAGSGANNNEWKRFNINLGLWEDLAFLPREKFKIGSGLCFDGDSFLYLTQGGSKYNAFFRLNLNSLTPIWESLPNLPLIGSGGKKKKIKEGGALVFASSNGKIYATKGGNTLEFWRFDPASDSWYQAEDVGSPQIPYKRIKGGGSLTYSSFAYGIFATIGNNTNEFWFYNPGKEASEVFFANNQLKNSNLSHKASMAFSFPITVEEWGDVCVYNLLGEVIGKVPKGEKTLDFISRLPSGIYFLEIKAKNRRETRKVIIAR